MKTISPLVTLCLLATSVLRAQDPVAAGFEAASVKVNRSGEPRSSAGVRGSQLVVINYKLIDIIRNAWGVQGNQITGRPDWIRADDVRFDITAKIPEGTKQPEAMRRTPSARIQSGPKTRGRTKNQDPSTKDHRSRTLSPIRRSHRSVPSVTAPHPGIRRSGAAHGRTATRLSRGRLACRGPSAPR